MATNDRHELEMNDLMIRFPHLMEQILRKLDNESLVKSIGVARIWKNFINDTKYPWVRIVKIPTILQGGDTYLHLAAKHNQIDVFEEIINGEAEKDVLNDSGYSPFLVACRFGSFRIAEFLMNKSEELKIDLSRLTNCHSSAFNLACLGGNSKLAEMIMKNSIKFQIHSFGRDHFGANAFHDACKSGNVEIVQMMIKNLAITNNVELNAVDRENNTALHLACDRKKPEVAKLLIEKASKIKLDLNARARTSNLNAFQMACISGLASVVEIMLSECNKFEISGGFHLACREGHINVVEIFIRKLEDSPELDFITKDDVNSGFHYAWRAGHTKIVAILKEKSGLLKLDLSGKQFGNKTGFKLCQIPESDFE